MLKILILAASALALSACILVPVGYGHHDNGKPGSEEHRGDHDGDRDEHKKRRD